MVATILVASVVAVAAWAWFHPQVAVRWLVYLNWFRHPLLPGMLKQGRRFFHGHPTRNITITTADGIALAGWHVLPAGAEAVKVAAAASQEAETGGDLTTGAAFDEACEASLGGASRVVLFLHGISGTRGGVGLPSKTTSARVVLARALATHYGCHVVTVDYRGFAGVAGSPSEAGLAADARAAWDWVTAHVDSSSCQVGNSHNASCLHE
jgi:hypothetical protein